MKKRLHRVRSAPAVSRRQLVTTFGLDRLVGIIFYKLLLTITVNLQV